MRRALAPLVFASLVACAGVAPSSEAPEERVGLPGSAPARAGQVAEAGEGEAAGESDPAAQADRKLIRTGRVRVLVDAYAPFQASLDERLAGVGGFISDSDLSHHAGRVSRATLTLRVPADRFDEVLRWTEDHVEVQSLQVDTADVTERWTDTAARIDNGRRAERRLLALLDEGTGDLEDVLAVERELTRIRGEVEAAEGRLRVLRDQVSLATLTLDVGVRALYAPPVEAGFTARLGAAMTGSLRAMVDVAEGVTIATLATAPWLLVLGLFGFAVRTGVRRVRRAS